MTDYVGQPSTRKILDMYREISTGVVKLQPDFQRKFVWNDKHKEAFLDTILCKFPFPEIYVADGEIDVDKKTTEKWIVDGQQRLSTIMDYIDGKNIKLSKIPKFEDLSESEKKDFFSYSIIVRDLGDMDLDIIKEVFKRINSVNYALNSIEIKNALYDGEYISTAKKILEDNNEFFESFDVFSTNEVLRMKDLEFILTLMSTIENKGYFTSTKENGKYIELYNEEYENKDYIQNILSKTFSYILKLDLDPYSIWQKKSNIFTLIVEVAKMCVENEKLPDELAFKSKVEHFESEMLSRKNNNPDKDAYAKYYINSLQGTNSKRARLVRGNIFQEYLKINCI